MAKLPYICPEHPDAQIRHEWDRTQYIMNNYPSGVPFDNNRQYFCNQCDRELAAESPEEEE